MGSAVLLSLCARDTGGKGRGAQELTVASAPCPAQPLLQLRQYRPSWLTSQHVWMCCLAGNVCATCSSRLSQILQGTAQGKDTLRHHHHHGFPLCPPKHPGCAHVLCPGCSQALPASLHLSMLDHSPASFLLFTCSLHPVLLPAPVPGWRLHSQVSWQVAFSHTCSAHVKQPHNSPTCLRVATGRIYLVVLSSEV